MTDTTTPAEQIERMKAAWQERHDETLTDAEAAYCVREHVDPGFMDFGSLTVLHAYRAGQRSTAEGVTPASGRWSYVPAEDLLALHQVALQARDAVGVAEMVGVHLGPLRTALDATPYRVLRARADELDPQP